jgi:hypothetical protein
MKLDITITLDSGGTISITGDDLTGEDLMEVVNMLKDTGHTFDGAIDPKDGPITDDMKDAFVDGFNEGRPEQENT